MGERDLICDFCGGYYVTIVILPIQATSAIYGRRLIHTKPRKRKICMSCLEIEVNISGEKLDRETIPEK